MAAKKGTKKSKKPTQKKSYYPTIRGSKLGHLVNTFDFRILHVDRALSRLNRRLYRQSKYYNVKIDLDHDDPHQYVVYALRDDWGVQKAYQLARAAYLDNVKEEVDMMGSNMVARWDDFRVQTGLSYQELYPALHNSALALTPLTDGEFHESYVSDASGANKTFTFGAASASRYSLLEEYDNAGNANSGPTTTITQAPYGDLNSEVNDSTVERLTSFGNTPPYDQNGVNASTPWVEIATIGATGGVQKLSTGYFCAPAGFVVIRRADGNLTWTPENLRFEVKSGDYKGVHAPSMLE